MKAKKSEYLKATFELVDLCDPPKKFTAPANLKNQLYTPSDLDHPTYKHADWTIEPTFCPFEYKYEWTKLKDKDNFELDAALTSDATGKTAFKKKDFDFLTITPVVNYATDKQVVTVTATTKTIHGTAKKAVVSPLMFDIKFNDPCFDSKFFKIHTNSTWEKVTTSDKYTNMPVKNKLSVWYEPTWCALTVTCDSSTV